MCGWNTWLAHFPSKSEYQFWVQNLVYPVLYSEYWSREKQYDQESQHVWSLCWIKADNQDASLDCIDVATENESYGECFSTIVRMSCKDSMYSTSYLYFHKSVHLADSPYMKSIHFRICTNHVHLLIPLISFIVSWKFTYNTTYLPQEMDSKQILLVSAIQY